MGKTQLAPGFRFHPTDVELVRYYLKRKVLGKKLRVDAIAELDIYKFEPSDLPDMSYIRSGDLKWHFFCPKEKKYSTGVRANRATECGYWKTTGKERDVLCNSEVVGKIRTLVYHFGKSPRGERTDWVMHEYRLDDKQLTQMNVPQDTYVVCVVFKKDGPGPRNGAQYGAPFREEDWSDGEEHTDVLATNNPTNLHGPNKETNLVVTASHDPKKDFIGGGMISESCVSDYLPATTTTTTATELPCPSDAANTPISIATTTIPSVLPYPCDAAHTPISTAPLLDSNIPAFLSETLQTPGNKDDDDDIYSMLDLFMEDHEWLPFSAVNSNEVRHDPGVSAPVCLEEGVFNELPDSSGMHNNGMARTPSSYDILENSELYIELQDLTAPLIPETGNLSSSGFPPANDDPYGFSASMGHRPDA